MFSTEKPASALVTLVRDAIEPAADQSFDDALTEHVQWVITQWAEGLDHLNDLHLAYEEDDHESFMEDMEGQASDALSDLVDQIDNIQIGYDFELTGLIYTSDIEEFYDENQDECDQYYDDYKDMADHIDELKSFMVRAAKLGMAYEAMTEFRDAIEDIDPEDII